MHIIDLDSPYAPPRYIQHETPSEVADVQWSPFASRDHWVISTSNQVALLWNLHAFTAETAIDHVLHGREGHNRAITDINFSAHDPDMVATCGVDSFVFTWDLRQSQRPAQRYADWEAGAQQVKFNRKDAHVLASAHNSRLHVWDDRKGAKPLYTIEAHQTKIYGIDWNRTDSMSILTCSLDKTIKLWNLADADLKPHRIMRVDYPVWRARHTPFGLGIIAMPHRDDHSVHLYDRRTYRISDRDSAVQPTHRFFGHQSNVREFLWRPRGLVEDGRDHRDFQLVTWGNDQRLLLHRVTEDMLSKVGYKKGSHFPDGDINFTRKGAIYRSFHDVRALAKGTGLQNVSSPTSQPSERPSTTENGRSAALRQEHSDGITPPSSRKSRMDALTWIKGVRIHKFDEVTGQRRQQPPEKSGQGIWTEPDELGAEVAWVAEKVDNVEIKSPDVRSRRCVVAFDAPWTEEGTSCWVKCSIQFPDQYPASRETPEYDFDWPASISEAAKTRLTYQLQALLTIYANAGRGSLETALRFLLGQRSFEESSAIDLTDNLLESARNDLIAKAGDQDDDDDDDEALESVGSLAAPNLDNSGTLGSAAPHVSNTNVPLPKACGAIFSPTGLLVCFFPKKSPAPLDSFINNKERQSTELKDAGNAKAIDEFNHLNLEAVVLTSTQRRNSSSSSSGESDTSPIVQQNVNAMYGKAFPAHFALHNNHFQEPSNAAAPSSYVILHNVQEVTSSDARLARGYKITGSGDDVCNHNAMVAKNYGYTDLAHTWEQLALLLARSVPLKRVTLEDGTEELVKDVRPLEELNRPDSGHGAGVKDMETSELKGLRGRVRWGGHPFGGENNLPGRVSLVQRILKKYEAAGDVQMLAMLACVLSPVPDKTQGSFAAQYPTYSPQWHASSAAASSIKTASMQVHGMSRRSRTSQATSKRPALRRSGSSISSSIPSSWSRSLAWLTSTSPQQAHTPILIDSDGEEEFDLNPDPVATGRVTIRLTNQEHFEEGAKADTPLIPREDDEKHRAWRSMYADQLQAWGLFSACCEMLKFGGMISTPSVSNAAEQYRSALFLRCAKCGEETQRIPPAHSAGAREMQSAKKCHACGHALRLPECPVCMETVRGLSVPCLRCGHVSHDHCLRRWHAEGGEDASMCPAGCGCECFGSSGVGPVEVSDEAEWTWEHVK